jgi:hypothetical protein
VNVIVLVVEDPGDPLNVTFQDVPEGKPVSLKLTEKVTAAVKLTATVTFALLTVTVPEDGEAEKPLTVPTVYG